MASPIDYTRARMGLIPNVVFLEGNGTPFCDHGFAEKTYSTELRKRNKEYVQNIIKR